MTTVNGITMLPCPFCGEKEYLDVSIKSSLYFTKAVCNECGAGGPNSSSAELAVEAWNKRTELIPSKIPSTDDRGYLRPGVTFLVAEPPEDEYPMAKPKRVWTATGKATLVDDLAASVAGIADEPDDACCDETDYE